MLRKYENDLLTGAVVPVIRFPVLWIDRCCYVCVNLCPCVSQVEEEVLRKYENDLLQKEHSGCAALLRDDKVSRASGV
jgi:hypothetical protein